MARFQIYTSHALLWSTNLWSTSIRPTSFFWISQNSRLMEGDTLAWGPWVQLPLGSYLSKFSIFATLRMLRQTVLVHTYGTLGLGADTRYVLFQLSDYAGLVLGFDSC